MALRRDLADDELAVLIGVDRVEAGAGGLEPFGAGDLAILVGVGAAEMAHRRMADGG